MNHLVDLKWQSFLNSSFVCQIEKKGYQGTNITLIFTRPVNLFLTSYFLPIFVNFENEVDFLIVNSLIDKDPKWLFFMSCFNFRLLLLIASQKFKIDAMVTFLWLIKRNYFSWLN